MSKSFFGIHEMQSLSVATKVDSIVQFADLTDDTGLAAVLTCDLSGSIIMLDTATSTAELPDVGDAMGCTFTFVVQSTAATCAISTVENANILHGALSALDAGIACVAKHTVSVLGPAVVGDRVTITSDGTNFYVSGRSSVLVATPFASVA